MPPAVLFDLNGVLVDDEALHEEAFRQVGADAGLTVTGEDYRRYFVGRTDRDGLRAFLAGTGQSIEGEMFGVLVRKAWAYEELAASRLEPCAGAVELVAALRVGGHEVGLVTGSARRETAVVLRCLGLADAFATVVTAGDVAAGKPSPEPYLVAARRLGRAAGDCVAVEDSPSGVAAARAAGMACVAVTSTHARNELPAVDLVVESLSRLDCATFCRVGADRGDTQR